MRRSRTVSMKSSAQRTSVLIEKEKKNQCYVQGQWRITTVPPFRNYALRGNHTAALDRGCGKSVSHVRENGSGERALVRTNARPSRARTATNCKITSAGDKPHVSETEIPARIPGPAARDRGPRLESKLRFLRNAHLAIALHRPRMETTVAIE